MITIKFSKIYKKFPPTFEGTYLTDVELVNLEDLDPDFLEYDTVATDGSHYALPKKGRYMILWLFTTDGLAAHRWQTIRRWTSEKEAYYRAHVNEEVRIEVTA